MEKQTNKDTNHTAAESVNRDVKKTTTTVKQKTNKKQNKKQRKRNYFVLRPLKKREHILANMNKNNREEEVRKK